MTAEGLQAALTEVEDARDRLTLKLRNVREELASVQRDNDKANELRSLAMEERLQVSLTLMYTSSISLMCAKCKQMYVRMGPHPQFSLFYCFLQIIAEFSELQQELRAFQSERDDLYKETRHQQSLLEELTEEKRKLEQDLDWFSKNGGVGGNGGSGFEKRGSGYEGSLPRVNEGSLSRGNSSSSGGGIKEENTTHSGMVRQKYNYDI